MKIIVSNCKHLFCSQPFVQQGERYFEQMIVHWSLHCISFSFSLTQKKQVALCLTVLNVLRLVWIQLLTIPATILSNIDMCHTCGVPSFVNFQACKSCSMPSNCSPKIFSKHYTTKYRCKEIWNLNHHIMQARYQLPQNAPITCVRALSTATTQGQSDGDVSQGLCVPTGF